VDLPWAASRSKVIVMIVMGGVPPSVMQVVDVIAVRHGGVPAAGPVPVWSSGTPSLIGWEWLIGPAHCRCRVLRPAREASSPLGDDRPFAHVGWCRRRRTPPA
jgi:hypothetical protein